MLSKYVFRAEIRHIFCISEKKKQIGRQAVMEMKKRLHFIKLFLNERSEYKNQIFWPYDLHVYVQLYYIIITSFTKGHKYIC